MALGSELVPAMQYLAVKYACGFLDKVSLVLHDGHTLHLYVNSAPRTDFSAETVEYMGDHGFSYTNHRDCVAPEPYSYFSINV